MPTGYTMHLMEKGQTFNEFVWGCARGFGALILMRDDPWDAPIPDAFEPSSYHLEKIESSRAELARLTALTEDQLIAEGEAEKKKEIDYWMASLAKDEAENARLDAMTREVAEWIPPTPDHLKLKEFILEQLRISRNSCSYATELIEKTRKTGPLELMHRKIERERESIIYHEQKHKEEIERANDRTAWIHQLDKSVPRPAGLRAVAK